jgi:hypothetical protein
MLGFILISSTCSDLPHITRHASQLIVANIDICEIFVLKMAAGDCTKYEVYMRNIIRLMIWGVIRYCLYEAWFQVDTPAILSDTVRIDEDFHGPSIITLGKHTSF